uniref:non-ribosomal peptide synthetase n=1 Tax=Francisella sp. SYW-9 TaxID=2610888 RepID=UPI00123DC5ED
SFNYLGQFDSQEGLWQLASQSSGMPVHSDNHDHNVININGIVIEGELRFNVVTQLGKDTTDKLSQSFQANLIRVQEHTQQLVEEGKEYHTPSDYGSNISIGLFDSLQEQAKKLGSAIDAIYPANSLQQGFIYHVLSNPDDDAYKIQVLFDYKQELDVDRYIKSWELAIEKYPILRTMFNWEEELIQIALSKGQLNYTYHDISDHADKDTQIKIIQEQDRAQEFDLSKPTQLRLHIIKQSQEHYTIVYLLHHIINDGWGGSILLNQVHEYYKELSNSKDIIVVEDDSYLRAQDYIQSNMARVRDYWQEQLVEVVANDLNPLLSTKVNLDDVNSLASPYNEVISITEDIYSNLKAITKELGITTNTLVQFVWHKLLQIYTQDQRTVVGTTVSGRDIPINGIEDSVGLYINTLPLIVDWDNENTVRDQLSYLHKQITNLSNHSYVNLAELQEQGQRLFHSLLVYENYPMPESNNKADKHILQFEFRDSVEKLDYPIGIIVYEHNNELYISIKTTEELVSKEKSQYHLNKLQLLLKQTIDKLDDRHIDLSILTEQEKDQIVYAWNQTDRDYPKDKTIYQLFEEQVKQNPNNVALVFEDQELTYKELNERSNQLARYIRKHYKEVTKQELKPDILIPLCLERSMDMLIGILAVMKAGGAYVPMDPEYPQERFRHILEDTQAKLVITQSHLEDKLYYINRDVSLISIDSNQEQSYVYDQEDKENLNPQSSSTDLAYVIYTSGTTGVPKGVMIEHKGLVNEVTSQLSSINLNILDKSLLTANYIFDASFECIFMSLLSSGELHILGHYELLDYKVVNNYIEEKGITVLNSTPSYINTIIQEYNGSSLTHIILGGEPYTRNIETQAKIYNTYGPTESSIVATISNSFNIGKAINNTKLYILDPRSQPVPTGVIGELYIGGAGLARGYLNRPELTAERFIPNLFATESDIAKGYTRLYKTGDLVRWLADGNIEYIGRNDDQVKIRGYRIELGEIDTQVRKLESVSNSITTAIKGNLYSYIELNKEASRVYKNSEYDFYIYSLEQRPDLKQKFVETQLNSWPEYFFLDKEEDLLWAELYKRYLKYQLVIVDQDDNIVAVCNCLPIYISDTSPKYPKTWENIFKLSFSDNKPSSLICISLTITKEYRGLGLFDGLIKGVFNLASQHDLSKVFISLRPLGKNKYPLEDIKNYCNRGDINNFYEDFWLRKNQQLGGELKQINERSQYITANIDFWEKCLNMKFPKSGVYTHKDLLNGLTIDLDKGVGEYCEPGIIFEYKFIKTQENDFFKITPEFVYKSLLLVLPEYMLPSSIRIMHKFPLTANGKLDRKALPAPEFINDDSYVAPTTELEERLCSIFGEVLGLERVGVTDDFFRIGGNSILAIKLSHRLAKELDKQINVADIFENKNIENMIFFSRKNIRLEERIEEEF